MERIPTERLAAALRQSWGGNTSASPDTWTPQVPAHGQCAVTALIVQDYLGGQILRAMVGEVSHYWNRLDDGSEIDLTREQFKYFATTEPEPRTREYILSYPETRSRYAALRRTVAEALGRAAEVDRGSDVLASRK